MLPEHEEKIIDHDELVWFANRHMALVYDISYLSISADGASKFWDEG